MLHSQTKMAIDALNEGRWGPVAELIQQVKLRESWRGHFKNFSEWLSHLTQEHKVSQARLWRYKAVGAYYHRLRNETPSLWPLSDLPKGVSAEALEVIERLERVAPDRLVEELKDRALAGKLPIKEIKTIWATYKAVPEKGDVSEAIEEAKRFEASCAMTLANETSWTGYKTPARCHVYRGVRDKSREFDAVAVVQNRRSDEVEIHVFDIKRNPDEIRANWRFPAWTREADFCWAVSNCAQSAQVFERAEEGVGVLAILDGHLTVERKATRQVSDETLSPFARTLLLRALRS